MSQTTTAPDAASPPTSPRIISVDDHVVESAAVWTSRVPAKFRDECPQPTEVDGKVVWRFAGKEKPLAELG